VNVLEAKMVRDSTYGIERPTVEVVTTTHNGGYQRFERYVLFGTLLDPAGPPWEVREFKVLGEVTSD
jgi:hypothetical protein